MRQKLYLIVFAVIAIIIIGCKGKDSRNLSEIPETMVCTHADSIALAVSNSQRNYDSAMRITLRLINLLKQVDNPLCASELQTLYLCLGDTKMMLERREEAAESYNEAYQWVLRTPNDSTCRPLAVSMLTGHGSHCLYLLPFLPQDSEHNDSRI